MLSVYGLLSAVKLLFCHGGAQRGRVPWQRRLDRLSRDLWSQELEKESVYDAITNRE